MAEHTPIEVQPGYRFLHRLVRFRMNFAYRSWQIIGRENVPATGSIIYAPNHTNCLMDAMLLVTCDSEPKFFVARADIFKNPKVKRILTFLMMSPINRIRDGKDSLKENDAIGDMAVNALKSQIPFCIMPEGRHRPQYSLLPLGKGLTRIAFQTVNENPGIELNVVPVGYYYSDFFRYHQDVLMTFGKPINVGNFLKENAELTEPQQLSHFTELLAASMKDYILYLPADEFYDGSLFLCAANLQYKGSDLSKRLEDLRQSAKRISTLRADDSNFEEGLLAEATAAAKICNEKGIDLESVMGLRNPVLSFLKAFVFVLLAPLAALCALAAAPTLGLSEFVASKFKDKAFRNSGRFGINLLVFPIFLIIYAILLFVFMNTWYNALGVLFIACFSLVFTQDYLRFWRMFISDLKFRKLFKNKDKFNIYG